MAHHTPFSFAVALGTAAVHTGVTLWYRWPIVMAAGAMSPQHAAELNRMVSEKVVAATLGMAEAQKQIMRLWLAEMTGRPQFRDGSAIAHASLRPALRTVKRNASRLHRKASRA